MNDDIVKNLRAGVDSADKLIRLQKKKLKLLEIRHAIMLELIRNMYAVPHITKHISAESKTAIRALLFKGRE